MESTHDISDLDDTRRLAVGLANSIMAPMTVTLDGDLGAGKTQFVRFFAEALDVAPAEVTSPTYVLLQRYPSSKGPIYHFDFYRLEQEAQVWDLGIDELFEESTIVLIEWANKFPQCLPEETLLLDFQHADDGGRSLTLRSDGRRATTLHEAFEKQLRG